MPDPERIEKAREIAALGELSDARAEIARLRELVDDRATWHGETLDELRDARSQIAQLRNAASQACEHVLELREAWERGVMREGDNLGGTRSNRNMDVHRTLWEALNGDPADGK